MATFQNLLNNISNNLGSYARGTWNNYIAKANEELEILGHCTSLDDKDITLLKKNLKSIKESFKTVNGSDSFIYYEGNDKKPVLAKPNSDKRNDVKDAYTDPKIGPTITNINGVRTELFYNEYENGETLTPPTNGSYSDGNGTLEDYDSEGIVDKTSKWMRHAMNDEKLKYIQNRFKTIISRFHTDTVKTNDITATASSDTYGMSHGRNLFKVDSSKSVDIGDGEGYENPYCRVWTWHHEYKNHIKDTMRPFLDSDGNVISQETLSDSYNWSSFRSNAIDSVDGGGRLAQHGAMYDNNGNTNGLVNITPIWKDGTDFEGKNDNVSLKHCMFSIENLAWKGVFNSYDTDLSTYDGVYAFRNGLSREQKGPLGGRIMWFPPYDIKFDETTNVEWDTNVFIGRGEPMYTYSNTSRGGSLSFKLLIDHPAILDYWDRRNDPTNDTKSSVDDVTSKEQELLRFFAGCSILTAKKPTIKKTEVIETPEQEKTPVVKKVDKVIQFFVFFPNNYSGKDDGFGSTNVVNPIDYLVNGLGTQKKYDSSSKKGEDFGVDMTTNARYNGSIVGGYEMRSGGVSIVTSRTKTNAIVSGVTIGDSSITLMKMYNESSKKGTPIEEPSNKSKAEQWHLGRYYYRADKNTLDQVFNKNNGISYIDTGSTQLNSVGYTNAYSLYTIDDKDVTFSLTDVYVAINGDDGNVLSGLYDSSHVSIIKSILNGEKGKITEIVCKGTASSQANSDNATSNQSTLAKNRALTIQKWLKQKIGNVKCSETDFKISPEKTADKNNANDRIAKLTRMTFVEIHYETEETEDATETQSQVNSDGTDSTLTDAQKKENREIANTSQTKGSGNFTLDEDDEIRGTNSNMNQVTSTAKKLNATLGRYDNEAQFFDRIGKENPFIARQLSERIKFFNPAFHSMSPEGFNARLTFLNQCCRQGPTFSHSDTENNADNLAFGRPPICVLRIGDFYNTKIVITSLGITYDPLTWDLNEEGIGVMPMIANVNISFNFIGGSELGGPIQRLQNALSFNYYANTSVSDNRAEQINYGEFGNVESFKHWNAGGIVYTNTSTGNTSTETENNES